MELEAEGNGLISPSFVEEMKRRVVERDRLRAGTSVVLTAYNPNSAEVVLRDFGLSVPRLYADRTLSEMIAFFGVDLEAQIVQAVSDLLNKRQSILLMGPTGTGKSALAAAILRVWNQSNSEWPGAFVHYPFYNLQRETLRGQELDRMQMTVIRTRSLVVLDDVGYADLSWKGEFATELPSALKHLSTIISMRTAEICPTIITTNLDETHMKTQYGAMVGSRLRDYTQIELLGRDLRG